MTSISSRDPSRSAGRRHYRAGHRRRSVGVECLSLTAVEAAHLARCSLTLTDGRSGRIVVPAETGDGDVPVLGEGERLIVLQVRLTGKT